ncbi:hypothetical protein [Streptomyces rubiginosohelvolus]|uniref:hypothetical protein n=1 Tax=Streptomyces rubiginosohelvolus TaxID=67362 RepID=UPI00386C6051|nr:hypothetical protein OG475_17805 [Streptomyces rubiginosohelvolus]
MALPDGVARITITDNRTHPDGGPMRGRIVVRPAPHLVTNPDSGHIVQGDAKGRWIDGRLAVTVLTADADGYEPTGYTHTVLEYPEDAPGREYPVFLTSALGPTVDLAALAPTEPYDGTYVLVPGPRGEKGDKGDKGDTGEPPSGDTIGVTRHIDKPADEPLPGSTALQDDDHLSVSVSAGGRYAIDAMLAVDGDPAADLLLTLAAPPGSTGYWTPGAVTLGVSDGTGSIRLTRYAPGAPIGVGIIAAGLIVAPLGTITAGANGTLGFQWAQNVSSATPTVVRAGSWLRVRRTA